MRKHYSPDDRRRLLLGILDFLHVANIQHESARNALIREDFSLANIPAVTPEKLLELLKKRL